MRRHISLGHAYLPRVRATIPRPAAQPAPPARKHLQAEFESRPAPACTRLPRKTNREETACAIRETCRATAATRPPPTGPAAPSVAVQFVLNYEEGGENCILHGDAASEGFLSEIPDAQPWPGQRHWNMESVYEYGARAGFWRLRDLFVSRGVPVTVYGVATALARSPAQVAAMQDAGWEIASHGLKWIDYRDHSREAETADIDEAIRLHTEVTGEPPSGWYTGRTSVHTVELASEAGSFDWISDTYDDDLPYWREHGGRQQLIIPYSLESQRHALLGRHLPHRARIIFTYLKDTFDILYAEGEAGSPKMMSVGLHCRLVGRPGRVAGARPLHRLRPSHDEVWIATRVDIAAPLARPPPGARRGAERPTDLAARTSSPASAASSSTRPGSPSAPTPSSSARRTTPPSGSHNALARAFRSASEAERLGVLTAHPDLAGKLAAAKRLTPESTAEQAGAGLDALTDAERARFTELNDAYAGKFGFPFIIAVRGLDKARILAAFETRIANDRDTEFATACAQVERIALLRLKDMLP